MQAERPRARRYPFVASVEVTDVQSEIHLQAMTADLSLFGCLVNTGNPLPEGTRVRLRIAHGSTNFEAFGKVAYAQPKLGMGVIFTSIEPNDQTVLENWLAKLRST